jgi:hypothetical protein
MVQRDQRASSLVAFLPCVFAFFVLFVSFVVSLPE